MSTYTAKISWKSDSPEHFTKNRYTRGHTWSFDGGIEVPASSSPHAVRLPFSVEAAVDPEEALVAAAASCHMLTFLWVAARKGFRIDSYEDDAVGWLEKNAEGRLAVTRVCLRPRVRWADGVDISDDALKTLHDKAHHACFIANSVKTEVTVEPQSDV